MFIKIERLNHNDEGKAVIINTDSVVMVKEITQESTKLYDEFGTLVRTEEPTETLYLITLKGGKKIKVNEANYNTLADELLK